MTAEPVRQLVLAPYAGHWQISTFPTSRVLRADCGHLAWISPLGEPYLAGATTICAPCIAPLLEDNRERDECDLQQYIVPGALDDVQERGGQSGLDAALRFMQHYKIGLAPTTDPPGRTDHH